MVVEKSRILGDVEGQSARREPAETEVSSFFPSFTQLDFTYPLSRQDPASYLAHPLKFSNDNLHILAK